MSDMLRTELYPPAPFSLKRLLSTLRWDIQLQFRNGFYYASAFVLALWALVFSQLPTLELGWLLPTFVLGNLIVSTFYYIGGLVLLEKGEGTLEAQIVTPMRTWEYLASKVITLTGLSLLESLVLVIVLNGFRFAVLPLAAGTILASAIYILVGFIAVARYDSINEYLFPSALYSSGFVLPLIDYFGLWKSWIFYLHPLQAPLLLMKAAFLPVEAWQLGYGLAYGSLWVWLLFRLSQNIFQRFVISKEGVK